MVKKVPRSKNVRWRSDDRRRYQDTAKETHRVGRRKPDFKKSHGDIHKGHKDRFSAVRRLSNEHSIKILCKVLKVSRSSYYAWLNRPESARSKENSCISELIKEIWLKSKKRYGYPKITAELKKQGISISSTRVWRLMCKLGIKSITMKKYRPGATQKDKIVRNNELKQDFTANKPNEKWVTDITYIKTVKDGWTYLASVMDLYTRKIIGWSYGKRMTKELAAAALDIALKNQKYPKGAFTVTWEVSIQANCSLHYVNNTA